LRLTGVTVSQAGRYELVASNLSGTVTSTATLTVRPRPDLRITEVQSSTATGATSTTADWWELTSFETQPINLKGWKFNDNSGSLTDSYVITNDLSIAGGESIVLVEGLTPAQFRTWWGGTNVALDAKIVNYKGKGLGFSAAGDGVRLYNDTATDMTDVVASVTFGSASSGVTFNYDPISGLFGAVSQLGVNGVVRAATSVDIGSPGRILAPATRPTLDTMLAGENIRIRFDAILGHFYSLETSRDLAPNSWLPSGIRAQATNYGPMVFEQPRLSAIRFYRVLVDD
jgi:hypothetical protein